MATEPRRCESAHAADFGTYLRDLAFSPAQVLPPPSRLQPTANKKFSVPALPSPTGRPLSRTAAWGSLRYLGAHRLSGLAIPHQRATLNTDPKCGPVQNISESGSGSACCSRTGAVGNAAVLRHWQPKQRKDPDPIESESSGEGKSQIFRSPIDTKRLNIRLVNIAGQALNQERSQQQADLAKSPNLAE